MNTFGFFGIDGQFVAWPSRGCLMLNSVQHALRAAQGRGVRCACGGNGRLIPFLDSRYIARIYNVRRESESDWHAPGCPAGDLEAASVRAVVYAVGSFDAPVEGARRAEPDRDELGRANVRYGSFTHLIHQLFAHASMQALKDTNSGATYRSLKVQPFGVDDLYFALRCMLARAMLRSGEPLIEALAARHREIVWGISSAPLAQALSDAVDKGCDVEALLHDVQTAKQTPTPVDRLIRFPASVIMQSGGRCSVHGSPIKPPYLYFVSVDSRPDQAGCYIATRAVLLPIAAIDAPYSVESQFERDVITELHHKGVALLKPNIRYPLAFLGPQFWNFGLEASGTLPHRPDMIVYSKGRCWLVELAGYDDNPEYMKLVASRLEEMIKVAASADVAPHTVRRSEFLATRR